MGNNFSLDWSMNGESIINSDWCMRDLSGNGLIFDSFLNSIIGNVFKVCFFLWNIINIFILDNVWNVICLVLKLLLKNYINLLPQLYNSLSLFFHEEHIQLFRLVRILTKIFLMGYIRYGFIIKISLYKYILPFSSDWGLLGNSGSNVLRLA